MMPSENKQNAPDTALELFPIIVVEALLNFLSYPPLFIAHRDLLHSPACAERESPIPRPFGPASARRDAPSKLAARRAREEILSRFPPLRHDRFAAIERRERERFRSEIERSWPSLRSLTGRKRVIFVCVGVSGSNLFVFTHTRIQRILRAMQCIYNAFYKLKLRLFNFYDSLGKPGQNLDSYKRSKGTSYTKTS